LTKPVAMRVAGTAEEEAKALLSQLETPLITMYPDMFQAAQAVSDKVKA